jgi:Na+-transporting NADH:ubiquinone oxidoreductase subunit C
MSDSGKEKIKAVIFALALGFVCSLILISASSGLKERQQKNILTDRQKNILKAAGIIGDDKPIVASGAMAGIESMYRENIKSYFVDPSGELYDKTDENPELMKIYLHIRDDNIESYIIPVNTKGLWGTILGYLAIKADGATIKGFTVYSHCETPGLGGEIESRWFRKNFVGKKIVNRENKNVSISIAKGKAPEKTQGDATANFVDGISGATLTGKYLSEGLKEVLLEYEPVSVKFRTGVINKKAAGGLDG